MKNKMAVLILLISIITICSISFVNAATISGSIEAQKDGADIITAPIGTTIQLVSSFTIAPVATGTGTVYYQYSADGITWGPDTTITTYTNWDGTERTVDFTLDQIGYYVFFLDVKSGYDKVTIHYPSTGTFHSDPPPPVPEGSSIAVLAISLAAVGAFATIAKRRNTPKKVE